MALEAEKSKMKGSAESFSGEDSSYHLPAVSPHGGVGGWEGEREARVSSLTGTLLL
jgi:hypothetical protein